MGRQFKKSLKERRVDKNLARQLAKDRSRNKLISQISSPTSRRGPDEVRWLSLMNLGQFNE